MYGSNMMWHPSKTATSYILFFSLVVKISFLCEIRQFDQLSKSTICVTFFHRIWCVSQFFLQEAHQRCLHCRKFQMAQVDKTSSWSVTMEFARGFHYIQQIQWQRYMSLKELKPATSCVRDEENTTTSARHMWETRTFKMTPIHASVIYQIPWIQCRFFSI